MKRALLILAACGKSSAPSDAPRAIAKAPVVVDAAPPRAPDAAPTADAHQTRAQLEEEAARYVQTLSSDGDNVHMNATGGSDLAQQIKDVQDEAARVKIGGGTGGGGAARPEVTVTLADALGDAPDHAAAVVAHISDTYGRSLARCFGNDGFRGTLHIELTINESGRVADASLDPADDCAKGVISSWKLAPHAAAKLRIEVTTR